MAKATLSFSLPDEAFEFKIASKAYEFYRAITEIKNELRNHRKYDKKLKEVYEAIEAICQEVDTETEG